MDCSLYRLGQRISAVGGIQEKQAGFTVMVRLADDEVEELARVDSLVCDDGNTGRFSVFKRAVKLTVGRVVHIREAQLPILVLFNSLHEGVGNADGNIKVGDVVLVGLALNEIFDIRMVHAQHGHIGAAAGARPGRSRRRRGHKRAGNRPDRLLVRRRISPARR